MSDTDDRIKLQHVLSLLGVAASLLASTDDTENNPLTLSILDKADAIVSMLGYKVVDLHCKMVDLDSKEKKSFTVEHIPLERVSDDDLNRSLSADFVDADHVYAYLIHIKGCVDSNNVAQALFYPSMLEQDIDAELGIAFDGKTTFSIVNDLTFAEAIDMWLNDPVEWNERNIDHS